MTIEEIRSAKSALRKKYKEIRANAVNKQDKNDIITNTVLSSMSYKYCNTILCYYSVGDEVSTLKLIEKALFDGKEVYLPKTYSKGMMKFFKVKDISRLKDGKFGIKEPDESWEEYAPGSTTAELCIVPGVCFDKRGCRLGYGKGYYDRFLSKFKGIAMGLTYSECITDEALIIEKRYDKSVDIITTEKEVIILGGK